VKAAPQDYQWAYMGQGIVNDHAGHTENLLHYLGGDNLSAVIISAGFYARPSAHRA
jgi:hypothetical protein